MPMLVQLHSVEGNTQKLDGGAMFGNAPKALWQRWTSADEHNRIDLACRSLLVRDDRGRNILFEAGIGAFFEPKMRERYGVQESEHVLLGSLERLGLRAEDIDIIVLSHLHFDHAGGLLTAWEEGKAPQLAFPRASYVVSRASWDRARMPHARDRASYIPELVDLLKQSKGLEIVESNRSNKLGEGYRFNFSDGHTPGLMLTRIETPFGPITFMGDLVPGAAWVHLPITMGYDRYPELLIDEKEALLEQIEREKGWVFFTHDPKVAAAKVSRDDKGRFHTTSEQAKLSWSAV